MDMLKAFNLTFGSPCGLPDPATARTQRSPACFLTPKERLTVAARLPSLVRFFSLG